ncbi:M15 family metallopeptidase [Sutcliffiella rhizosphaerae]|uniref:Carboxypeptidase YodJ n=1 Tax=Sutcliffiella rhizosphaerae TaxID=2880967 RepID=A0ABM8YPU8_9BACI|nr:M15 family metallopeptidase [Sutcliffiella rhizosphaerae]CAG9621950.1 Putative carboxypeptidase YodJ [Sutcliffiella rhizosphaerae]
MKKKHFSAFMILMLLTGCTKPVEDINWKFWEYFTNGTQEEGIEVNDPEEQNVEEQPVEEVPDEEPEQDLPETNDEQFVLADPFFTVLNDEKIIENTDNILVLVNKNQSLPTDYIPKDLTIPDVPFSFEGDYEKKYLRKEAAQALESLFTAAEKDGIEIFAVSGYRSYETQNSIYNSYIKRWGEEKTNAVSAVPGHSEHQTGLAMDISSHSAALDLTEEFGETTEGKWVKEHASEHGFIIRYPEEGEPITGYQYEPWHLRYVGNEVAAYMYEHNLTLEEFFDRAIKQ